MMSSLANDLWHRVVRALAWDIMSGTQLIILPTLCFVYI